MRKHAIAWPAVASGGRARMSRHDEARYCTWFAGTFGDGEEVQVIVQRVPKAGSPEQAGYYFGPVLGTLAAALGYTDTYDLHIDLMGKLRPKVRDDGLGLQGRERWRDYDMAQRAAYVTDVIQFAEVEAGVLIPRPGEVAA